MFTCCFNGSLLESQQSRIYNFDEVRDPIIRNQVKMEQIHRWVAEKLTEQVKECNKSWMVYFSVADCRSLTEALEFKDGKYKELLARFDEKYDTELKSGSEEGKRLKIKIMQFKEKGLNSRDN